MDASPAGAAHRRALATVALSAFAFGLMAFQVKLAARTLPAAEITLFRFLFMLLPFAVVPRLVRRALTWQRLDLLLYRGLFGGTAVLLYFFTIAHIPVGVATLLNYSSPVWAVPLAAVTLGDRVRPALVVPFAVALTGMGLVTGAIGPGQGFPRLGIWEIAGLGSSMLSAAAVVAIRAARRTEGSWAIFASFTVFGLLVSVPFAIPVLRAPVPREWLLLCGIGACSIVAQLAMTHAYRWVTNLQAGVFAQLTVVVSMALGVLMLDEPFGATKLLGCALALSGVVGVVWLQATPRAVE
jgi:drug/metabolite transporter (DMT)-like permease